MQFDMQKERLQEIHLSKQVTNERQTRLNKETVTAVADD